MKSWQSIVFGVVSGSFIGIILLSVIYLVSRQPQGLPITLLPAPTQAPIIVQVVGEVANPGVYSLPPGSRVQDAVNAAGGFTDKANQAQVNLASHVKDGEKIRILQTSAAVDEATQEPSGVNDSPKGISIPGEVPLIDINTATLEELDSLPGIGNSRAQEIIRYREEHGGFKSVDELKEVEQIGDAIFEQIKDLVTVEPGP